MREYVIKHHLGRDAPLFLYYIRYKERRVHFSEFACPGCSQFRRILRTFARHPKNDRQDYGKKK